MTTNINEEDFENAVEMNIGWCTQCEDFTRECTEPDAEDYDCPVCEENSVIGAEQALLTGFITF